MPEEHWHSPTNSPAEYTRHRDGAITANSAVVDAAVISDDWTIGDGDWMMAMDYWRVEPDHTDALEREPYELQVEQIRLRLTDTPYKQSLKWNRSTIRAPVTSLKQNSGTNPPLAFQVFIF
ncbi:hypothetical protein QYF36_024995 [Acer negundo]|nr:hypothetical protein QYF36_024995 [Acer negundo]